MSAREIRDKALWMAIWPALALGMIGWFVVCALAEKWFGLGGIPILFGGPLVVLLLIALVAHLIARRSDRRPPAGFHPCARVIFSHVQPEDSEWDRFGDRS